MTSHVERDAAQPEHTPNRSERARKATKATNGADSIQMTPEPGSARHGPGNGPAGPLPPGGDEHHMAIEGNGLDGEQSPVTESAPAEVEATPQDAVPTGRGAVPLVKTLAQTQADQHRFLSMLVAGRDPGLHFLVSKKVPCRPNPDMPMRNGKPRDTFATETWREQYLDGPWYFSACASDHHKLRRQANAKALRAVILDDVGTKVDPAAILAPPTWRLETSPGNEQWGYLLHWSPDVHAGDELYAGLVEAKLQDPGVRDCNRLFRIPGSINDKPGRNNFVSALREFTPERVYTLASLTEKLQVKPVPLDEARTRTGKLPAAGQGDDIFDWLLDQGMVVCEATDGYWEVECPFADEHTTGTGETCKYLPRYMAETGCQDARCHHSHGEDLAAFKRRFFDWVLAEGGPKYDPQATTAAALAEFSALLRRIREDTLAAGKPWEPTPWPTSVRAEIAKATAAGRTPGLHEQAILPADWPVPRITTNPDGTITRKIVSHPFNVEHLLKTYGFTVAYNVITKRLEWSHGGLDHTTDNADEALLSMVHGLCKLNGLPVDMLGTHLCAVAEANQRNPVVEYMHKLKWDGKPHIAAAAARIECSHPEHAQVILRRWMIQACAAADAGEQGHAANPEALPVYESVMTLIGNQGVRKTKGLLNLVPEALRRFVKTGLVLDPKQKDSLLQASAYWIAELGEVDATFKRAEATIMKAWLSLHEDDIRKPYARTPSRMKRRTVLCATANEDNPLIDQTGNRRWWVLRVTSFALGLDAEALDQLWAEAWAAYVGGEQWWPLESEKAMLMAGAEAARRVSGIEAKLTEALDWDSGTFRTQRFTAVQIGSWATQRGFGSGGSGLHYESLEAIERAVLSAEQLREVGLAMRRLHLDHGAKLDKDGVLKLQRNGEWVKANADAGQNRGWLVPVNAPDPRDEALAEALAAAKKTPKKAS